jgi:hypothetical protein
MNHGVNYCLIDLPIGVVTRYTCCSKVHMLFLSMQLILTCCLKFIGEHNMMNM